MTSWSLPFFLMAAAFASQVAPADYEAQGRAVVLDLVAHHFDTITLQEGVIQDIALWIAKH